MSEKSYIHAMNYISNIYKIIWKYFLYKTVSNLMLMK